MTEIKYTYRYSADTEKKIDEIRTFLRLTGERDKNKAFDIVFNNYMSLINENRELNNKLEISIQEHKREILRLNKTIDSLTSSIPTIVDTLDKMVLSAQESKKALLNFLPN